MTKIVIPLEELVVTPGAPTDRSPLHHADLPWLLRAAYGFLGLATQFTVNQGALHITLQDLSGYQREQGIRNHELAVKLRNRVNCDRGLLQRNCSAFP